MTFPLLIHQSGGNGLIVDNDHLLRIVGISDSVVADSAANFWTAPSILVYLPHVLLVYTTRCSHIGIHGVLQYVPAEQHPINTHYRQNCCRFIREGLFLRMLRKEMGVDRKEGGTLLLVDNQSSIKLANNPIFHKRSKHIAIRYYFMGERIEMGEIDLKFVRALSMGAD